MTNSLNYKNEKIKYIGTTKENKEEYRRDKQENIRQGKNIDTLI